MNDLPPNLHILHSVWVTDAHKGRLPMGEEMKPFDLEAAKRGEEIMFRDGHPCTFGAHIPRAGKSQRLIVIDASGNVNVRPENGKHPFTDTGSIVMAPRKRTVHVTLMTGDKGLNNIVCTAYESRALHDNQVRELQKDCYRILDTFTREIEE